MQAILYVLATGALLFQPGGDVGDCGVAGGAVELAGVYHSMVVGMQQDVALETDYVFEDLHGGAGSVGLYALDDGAVAAD